MTEQPFGQRPAGPLAGGLPPGDAVVTLWASGDAHAAALCVVLTQHEENLGPSGDWTPTLWAVARHHAPAGQALLSIAPAWQVPVSDPAELPSALLSWAACLGRTQARGGAADIFAWVLTADARLASPAGAAGPALDAHLLAAADRAGVSYQLLRPRHGAPALYVQRCPGAGPLSPGVTAEAAEALHAIVAATPLAPPVG